MHSDVVQRTQIYLDVVEQRLLDEAAKRTGASRSELIRRAIRTQYQQSAPVSRLAALRASAGAWSDRPGTGADYVDARRGDLNSRLERVGLPDESPGSSTRA